ncbi:MAG TPA: phospholipase D family protein [Desulfomonilia bacterium]|jgi:phosphatidylserine/phosphatidylglycerophosphate/cardiolipin synthase-like enzyme|nr:phospholipase D family protein [Desulfomonilia bacterium]
MIRAAGNAAKIPVRSSVFLLATSFFLVISVLSLLSAHAEQFNATGTMEAYFSPHDGVTEAIVKELTSAKSEILVQAYSFTSKPIAEALVDAKKRGIKIEVVLDRSQKSQAYSSADFVAHAGIPTYVDSAHAIAHNKIMIIDRSTVITGSFNFTRAAEENNAENILIIKGNKALVDRYVQNFNEHKGHSERYEGR